MNSAAGTLRSLGSVAGVSFCMGFVTMILGAVFIGPSDPERPLTHETDPAHRVHADLGPRRTAATNPKTPGSGARSIDAVAAAATETVPSGAADYGDEAESLRGIYESMGGSKTFEAMFGPVPVLPAGLSRSEYLRSLQTHPEAALFESSEACFRRLNAPSKFGPRALSERRFQSFGYSEDGSLEIVAGMETGAQPMLAFDLMRMTVLGHAGIKDHRLLGSEKLRRVDAAIIEWSDRVGARARFALWNAVSAAIHGRRFEVADAALTLATTRDDRLELSVIRRGTVAEVDRLLLDLDSARRRCRAVIESIVGQVR